MSDGSAEAGGDGVVEAAPEVEGFFAADEWWPILVMPWVALLSVAGLLIGSQARARDDYTLVMIASLFMALIGFGLYALLLRLVSRRHFPRLRRRAAVLSTGVGFVGITTYYVGFILAMFDNMGRPIVPDFDEGAVVGLGAVICFGWGLILVLVALFAHLAGPMTDPDVTTDA